MTAPGDQGVVDAVAIGVGLLARVTLGDGLPHLPARRGVAGTNGKRERLHGLEGPGKPDPRLVLLAPDEGPYLVTLDGVAFYGGKHATLKGREGLDFF